MATTQLINKEVTLERFPGKGGWTYAPLGNLSADSRNALGWIKVSGSIDDYEIGETHLMPMGKGNVFLAVKAEIRKKIRKEAGDRVKIILFVEDLAKVEPSDFLECLKDEPGALSFYNSLSQAEKDCYIHFIYDVKAESKKLNRIVIAINSLLSGRKSPPLVG